MDAISSPVLARDDGEAAQREQQRPSRRHRPKDSVGRPPGCPLLPLFPFSLAETQLQDRTATATATSASTSSGSISISASASASTTPGSISTPGTSSPSPSPSSLTPIVRAAMPSPVQESDQRDPPPPLRHHHHHVDLPLEIKALCDEVTASFNKSILGHAIIKPIQSLRRACEAQNLWHAALEAIPLPASRVIQALADIEPIPEKFDVRISKICARFEITRAEFDKFFCGANSHGFFETLTKVSYDDTVSWPLLQGALAQERDRRLRGEIENSAHAVLWQPGDVRRALELLRLNIDVGRATRPKKRRYVRATSPEHMTAAPHPPSDGHPSLDPSPEHGRRAASGRGDDNDNDDMDSSPPSASNSPLAKRSRAGSGGSPSPDNEMDWNDTGDARSFLLDTPLPMPSLVASRAPSPSENQPRDDERQPGRIKGVWGIGTDPADMDAVRDNSGWLTGTVLDMALEACCVMTPSFVSTPCLLFGPASQPERHVRYAERLRRLVASDENTTFLLPLNVQGYHWAIASLAWRQKTATIFDSAWSESHDKAIRVCVRTFVERFLQDDIIQWQVTTSPCPQQEDGSSCGLFAIANAMHLASGRSLPDNGYHVGLWRSVLGRLVAKDAVEDERAIWPFTVSMDDAVAAVNPSLPEVAEAEAAVQAWQQAFTSGSISETMALVAKLTRLSIAPASRSLALRERALRDRHRVLGELRVLAAFLGAARRAVAPEREPGHDHDASTVTDKASSLDDDLAKYRKVQATLSECHELAAPGQLSGIAAKIAELEKAKVEMEKEDTRAASAKKKEEHRARLAEVVVERLGSCIDMAVADALGSIKRLQSEYDIVEGGASSITA